MKINQTKLTEKNIFDLGIGGLSSGFGGMLFNDSYKERCVANTKTKDFTVDTAYTPDTGYFETGIIDTRFRPDGCWIIVDECETKGKAKKMHNKWVKILSSKVLPDEIEDIHSSEVYKLNKK
jgi:hypothetical protein